MRSPRGLCLRLLGFTHTCGYPAAVRPRQSFAAVGPARPQNDDNVSDIQSEGGSISETSETSDFNSTNGDPECDACNPTCLTTAVADGALGRQSVREQLRNDLRGAGGATYPVPQIDDDWRAVAEDTVRLGCTMPRACSFVAPGRHELSRPYQYAAHAPGSSAPPPQLPVADSRCTLSTLGPLVGAGPLWMLAAPILWQILPARDARHTAPAGTHDVGDGCRCFRTI